VFGGNARFNITITTVNNPPKFTTRWTTPTGLLTLTRHQPTQRVKHWYAARRSTLRRRMPQTNGVKPNIATAYTLTGSGLQTASLRTSGTAMREARNSRANHGRNDNAKPIEHCADNITAYPLLTRAPTVEA